MRQQEGHLYPANPADLQLQHEDRLVSDAPYSRNHEAGMPAIPPMGGEGETLEADMTFVGRKPGTKVRAAPAT